MLHEIAIATKTSDEPSALFDGMPDEPLGIERASWDLDPDDSPATHHFWRRTQSNTRGSTKKADDDEEPCAGVENATTTRRVTGHTTGQQHQDGVRGNGEWGLEAREHSATPGAKITTGTE